MRIKRAIFGAVLAASIMSMPASVFAAAKKEWKAARVKVYENGELSAETIRKYKNGQLSSVTSIFYSEGGKEQDRELTTFSYKNKKLKSAKIYSVSGKNRKKFLDSYSFTVNSKGQITKYTSPYGKKRTDKYIVTCKYAKGKLVQKKHPATTYEYTYTSKGNRKKESVKYFDGGTDVSTYSSFDKYGNPKKQTGIAKGGVDPDYYRKYTNKFTYKYDKQGRLTQITVKRDGYAYRCVYSNYVKAQESPIDALWEIAPWKTTDYN